MKAILIIFKFTASMIVLLKTETPSLKNIWVILMTSLIYNHMSWICFLQSLNEWILIAACARKHSISCPKIGKYLTLGYFSKLKPLHLLINCFIKKCAYSLSAFLLTICIQTDAAVINNNREQQNLNVFWEKVHVVKTVKKESIAKAKFLKGNLYT